MRLIHVHTYQLHEFLGNSSTCPNYSILSHTWEDEEVSFQDIQDLELARRRKGFNKIKFCCEQAAKDGFEWAWVDTCCIDKTSSAELSEAINSMYKWYGTAMVCYAYLSDVDSVAEFNWKTELEHIGELPRWFKRGWTLQELIAPLIVKFFTKDWRLIGTKKEEAVRLSNITGIDEEVLRHKRSVLRKPVAERMYWASSRRTTRTEDLAYCLMGLFDVNMPLLYGEGMKAFERLQEQILKTTNDDTLFLWQMRSPTEQYGWSSWGNIGGTAEARLTLNSSRMLASSPGDFDRPAGHYLLQPEQFCEPQLMPRELGLRITLPMRKMDSADISRFEFPCYFEHFLGSFYFAALGCLTRDGEGDHFQVAILLDASTEVDSPEKKVLARLQQVHCFFPFLETKDWQRYTCFVAGEAPTSFEKTYGRLFLNYVDLSADTTFAIENIEATKYLDCSMYMSAAYVIQCGDTGQDYLLTFAMDSLRSVSPFPSSIRRIAFIQFEALPAKYDTLVVQNRYMFHIPRPIYWTLYLREGYGPVLEYEVSLESDLGLVVVLKCEEGRSGDIYKLHVRCTRTPDTSPQNKRLVSWLEKEIEYI
ncbi:hypothetical protein diail_8497 [Diaporthe ilicicola]|nr:hypothetical protein diail_8497 [Diaporthe ilicicola]